MLEKNEGNTVKKIRSTEQILVLAILLFTYFLETFQVAYAQKAENLPQIVSWQDGKGYQSDGTFIADGWGYDTVNPAGKYVLFDENGMVQLRTERETVVLGDSKRNNRNRREKRRKGSRKAV